jgi:hypothetical protein
MAMPAQPTEEHRLGEVIISPADVMFGPRTMVEPELFAMPLTPGPLPRAWEEVGRLLLAVEVLSPSTLRTDRGDKRDLHQRARRIPALSRRASTSRRTRTPRSATIRLRMPRGRA